MRFLEVVLGPWIPRSANQGEAAVAGIHHKEKVLCRNGLGNILKVGHGDGLSLVIFRIGVNRHDIAEIAAARKLPSYAVACEKHKNPVFPLHLLRIPQGVPQHREDAAAGWPPH